MTKPFPACNESQLRQLLTGDAPDHAAAKHLETCPRCQSRLSELAASQNDWHETRDLLAVAAADAASAAEARERSWSDPHGARPAAWTETMARQLLGPPSHPEMLGRLGRYEVERLIGSGGMGIVFKGFDTELNRPVAIKILAPHLAGSGAARQRFSREARAAAAVVHEHVVAIHNVESDGTTSAHQPEASARAPFLVMQYVAGESLQARLDRQGPLALKEILRIAHQTAAGLAAAHAQGLVHRDVKPSNILLEQGIERALLTDFGLARAADDASLTHTGYMPGTPHYMSPEQARGDTIDATSDLFSLGSVIYAMCTGRPPFRADTSFGVLRRITDTDPRPIREINPDLPAWLPQLVDKLLAKRPADRFASAAEAADLLEKCLAHVQQPTTAPLPAACRERPLWRSAIGLRNTIRLRATLVLTSAVLVLLAGLASLYFAFPRHPAAPQANDAESANVGTLSDDQSPAVVIWESSSQEIHALRTDIDSLEPKTDRLWDIEPLRAGPTPTTPPTNQPNSEPQP
jgi:serine/threonine-protein kinase